MENEVETYGGGNEAVKEQLSKAVRGGGGGEGPSGDACMRKGLKGMASGGEAGMRVRVNE